MDIKLIISIYAAVISTFVFVWRMYEFFHQRRGRLSIQTSRRYWYPTYYNGQIGEGAEMLEIKITNKGERERYIERPIIECVLSSNKSHRFSFINQEMIKNDNFPKLLKNGEVYNLDLPYEGLISELNRLGSLQYRVLIKDTQGKTYTSMKYSV